MLPPALLKTVIVMAFAPSLSGMDAVHDVVPAAVPEPPVVAFDQVTDVIVPPEAVPLTPSGSSEVVDGGGVIVITGGGPLLIVSDTERVVFPLPLVVLVIVTVSVCGPAASEFAPLLMETVSVAVAPAASVPLAAERVTQACVFAAVQLSEALPEFVSV